MDRPTAAEIRELLKKRFNLELEGRIYRLQFDFEKNLCYMKFYDDKPILPPLPPRSIYVLNIHEVGAGEPSDMKFPTAVAMERAYDSFKLLNRYHLWCEVDGEVIKECYPEKRRI